MLFLLTAVKPKSINFTGFDDFYLPQNKSQKWWISWNRVPPSFVPSTIHWMPAKLLNGVMPHRKYRCRTQLLFFCLIVTDLLSSVVVLNGSVGAMPHQTSVVLLLMQFFSDFIVYGFLFSKMLLSLRYLFISHSAEFWIMLLMFVVSYTANDVSLLFLSDWCIFWYF